MHSASTIIIMLITQACQKVIGIFALQILPAGASKGKGVDQLLKYLDVKPERVLAMGDGENDKVMLQV